MSRTTLKPRPSPAEALAIVDAAAGHLPSVAPPPAAQAGPQPAASARFETGAPAPWPRQADPLPPGPAAGAAPSRAPAAPEERAELLNIRLRTSTILEISRLARERGMTMKQIVTHALRDAGANVAARDLEDHTARRRGG